MNIINITRINLKKLKEHKGKAMFLILPITILVMLTVVITSQLLNIQNAITQSVFGTIENQSTVLTLSKNGSMNLTQQQGNPGGGLFFNSDNNYTQNDIAKISAIDGVSSASLNTTVPISNIKTSDLFNGITYAISNLAELKSENATLYSEEDFIYTEGDAIPIILNASTFTQSYEDWGGNTSITVTFSRNRNTPPTQSDFSASPVKNRAIEYSKNDLIDKTFTISFGGLDTINDYSVTQSSSGLVFTKITDDEYAAKVSSRESVIDDYWDYTKITTPISYKFRVVGIIEDDTTRNSFIPADFASVLMKDYVQNQLNARNSNSMPTTLLNSTYLGLTYNGTELASSSNVFAGRGMGLGRPGESSTSATSYNIPGLVIKTSENGLGTVEGEYIDASVYDSAARTATSITITLASATLRSKVVASLNAAGYAYQDLTDLGVFSNLKSTLSTISLVLSISFIVISVGVIIFAMTKFVSESRKEIGIFRAIGMKKFSIVILFTSQALLYGLIAYIIGGTLGIALNAGVSNFVGDWFNSFISSTVQQTFSVVNKVDASIFTNLDVISIGIYSLALLGITVVISLIPAIRASSISPVEAIKGD